MNTHFTLKEIFNVYHDKCNELDRIQNINDKLIEQNEKLINTNIMYSNEIQELKGIVSREMKKNKGRNNSYKDLTKNKETFIDRWDDYNHG